MLFTSNLKYIFYWNGIHISQFHYTFLFLFQNGKLQQVWNEISILNNDTRFESVVMGFHLLMFTDIESEDLTIIC